MSTGQIQVRTSSCITEHHWPQPGDAGRYVATNALMVKAPRFLHFVKDPDCWTDKKYVFHPDWRPFAIRINTGGPEPTETQLKLVSSVLNRLPALKISAAEIAQHNYDYDHFLALGTPRLRLIKDPTPVNLAAKMIIRSIDIFSPDTSEFEISFDVSWDDYHSYEVYFDATGCVSCAVNDNGLFEADIRESQLCIPNRHLRKSVSSTDAPEDVLRLAVINEIQHCGFGRGKRLRRKLIHLHDAVVRPPSLSELRDYPTLHAEPLITRLSLAFPWVYKDMCEVIDQMIDDGCISLSYRNQIVNSAFDI